LGEGRGVHRFAVQQMHTIHSGAPAWQESGNVQSGIHGPETSLQLFRQHSRFKHAMTAQGGIASTHQQQLGLGNAFGFQRLVQRVHDLAIALSRRIGGEGTGVRQNKQKWRTMAQAPSQALHIPTQQQRTAVHRLGTGGIVVDHNKGHGTIISRVLSNHRRGPL